MARIAKHNSLDWCHLCGQRSDKCIDVFYSENAENALIPENLNTSDYNKYLRICCQCVNKLNVIYESESTR